MDWVPFHHPTDNFSPFVRWLENFLVTQKALYITNGHFFEVCPKKVLRVEEPLLHSRSKRSFHYSTDRMNRSVTILSHERFPLYFTTDIFPQKLGTPFQKTFLAPDSPST